MSRHWILDGYNVMYAWDGGANGPLQKRRLALLDALSEFVSVDGSTMTIVFDGRPGGGGSAERHDDITVVWSRKGLSADGEIERMVRKPIPKDSCVVTSDRMERLMVEGANVPTIGAALFVEEMRRSRRFIESMLGASRPPSGRRTR